jgi:putative phosphoribosyl transferase
MLFADPSDGGRQLAAALSDFADSPNTIVLGIPRGGVAVAAEIARTLHLSLDVFLVRKLGVPGHEELAFGAVAANGTRYLDKQIVSAAGITEAEIDKIATATLNVLEERAALYRAGREPLQIAERSVILVDDGIATGASFFAAIQALRQLHPGEIIAATPVAPLSTAMWLRTYVDRLVCIETPPRFQAVGQFYGAFPQLSDSDVIELLTASR